MSEQQGAATGYPEYAASLSEAFTVFAQKAERMKEMYQKLEERISYLTGELERKNLELEKTRRLASLVELAAGVAHEIRNPLGGIELCATMLSRELRAEESSQELVGNIIEGVRRLNSIVTNLLTLTREDHIQARRVDLDLVVNEALAACAVRADGIKVEQRLCGGVEVPGDPDRLRQVFINMVTNAAEAMTEGGTLTVLTGSESGCAVVEFRDTGKGIGAEEMEKIFNPFFTTKECGTGLGLSISYKIVNDHGGRITVQSEVGKGSTFKIFLPRLVSGTKENNHS